VKQLIRFGPHTDYQRGVVINHVSKLEPTEKMSYEVTIKPYKKSKTLEQLGYYWDVIVPMVANYQGDSLDNAHESLKGECLMVKKFYTNFSGDIRQTQPSIKKLKVKEMAEYIDLCIILMAKFDVICPPPTIR